MQAETNNKVSDKHGSKEPADHSRDERLKVDETEIVSHLLFERRGRDHVMLDVGAHFGTSASFFHRLGWTIFCFEPDPANREKLAAKFGSSPNITIDPRAVSDKPATGVSFFTSDESTGISGLHAFRETHRERGKVDVTTVGDIVRSRGITSIDFLKIDVEGFDFAVLRGVPWDVLRPDVIECEFEDLKTRPLGHSYKEMAQYLMDKGYAVYLSEWHPIIRYGISHDWRRVVPYPADGVPSDAWGNILAFRQDPGIETVTRAFDAVVARAAAEAGVREIWSRTSAKRVPDSGKPKPPAIAAKLSERTSSPTTGKSHAKPAHKKKSRKPVSAKRKLANTLRRRALPLFRVAQIGAWIARAAWNHKVLALVAVAICALLVALPFFQAPLWDWRYGFWLLAVAILSLGAATVVVRQVWRRLSRRRSKEIEKAVRKATDRRINSLKRRLAAEEAKQRTAIVAMRKDVTSKMAQTTLDVSRSLETVKSSVAATEVAHNRRLEQRLRESNYSNAFRVHSRLLTNDDIEELNNNWLKTFGLDIPKNQLRYMAHQICMAEERCEGRMATTIQAAMLRTLALLSLPGNDIELLEIGTLFGVASGSLHNAAARAGRKASLTLLDPLEGYYDQGLMDAQTGVQVTRTTLVGNLAAMGVPLEHYRIIQRLSTDSTAVAEASDRQYDYLLIDGDHTIEGVAADFDLYGPMVKPGGVVIFDDYDTTDWPAIKPYVDQQVRTNPNWLWIGAGWRTAILRRK